MLNAVLNIFMFIIRIAIIIYKMTTNEHDGDEEHGSDAKYSTEMYYLGSIQFALFALIFSWIFFIVTCRIHEFDPNVMQTKKVYAFLVYAILAIVFQVLYFIFQLIFRVYLFYVHVEAMNT